MPTKSSPVIVWFRKDLRLADNLALLAAVEHGGPVMPIYIRETSSGPLGGAQEWWLHHSLASLSAALEKCGSRLLLRSGNAEETLRRLIAETGADAVLWNRRYEPTGMATDKALKEALGDDGLTVRSFAGHLLHEPSRVQTKSGGPYRVYTPFWRALEGGEEPHTPADAPQSLKAPETWPKSEKLNDWKLASAGQTGLGQGFQRDMDTR